MSRCPGNAHPQGADHVIDYTRADLTSNGRSYDSILDLAAHRSALAYQGSLIGGGRYLYVGGSAATLLQVLLLGPLLGRAEGRKLRLLAVRSGGERLAPMVALCQAGTIATVIDRRYRLPEVPVVAPGPGGASSRG